MPTFQKSNTYNLQFILQFSVYWFSITWQIGYGFFLSCMVQLHGTAQSYLLEIFVIGKCIKWMWKLPFNKISMNTIWTIQCDNLMVTLTKKDQIIFVSWRKVFMVWNKKYDAGILYLTATWSQMATLTVMQICAYFDLTTVALYVEHILLFSNNLGWHIITKGL